VRCRGKPSFAQLTRWMRQTGTVNSSLTLRPREFGCEAELVGISGLPSAGEAWLQGDKVAVGLIAIALWPTQQRDDRFLHLGEGDILGEYLIAGGALAARFHQGKAALVDTLGWLGPRLPFIAVCRSSPTRRF